MDEWVYELVALNKKIEKQLFIKIFIYLKKLEPFDFSRVSLSISTTLCFLRTAMTFPTTFLFFPRTTLTSSSLLIGSERI